jgi:hypothetical protein
LSITVKESMQKSTNKMFHYVLFHVSIVLAVFLFLALFGYRDHGPLIDEYNIGLYQKVGLVLLLVVFSFLTYYSGSKYYNEK